MYCRECGKPMENNSRVCPGCGVPAGKGRRYCPNCGAQVSELAVYCVKCGSPLGENAGRPDVPPGYMQKSKLAAGLLGILIGALGIHNFYLGYTSKGVAQLLISVLSCGILAFASAIWGLVEGIMILTDPYPVDAAGVPLRE